MKITWLGQAGLMFETNGKIIVVDPYLSDSVEKIEPHNKRRVPADESFLKIKPDIIALTHNHLDHTDPETLKHYLGENSAVTVLASKNAWNNVRNRFGGINNNYIMFNECTEHTEGDIKFTAAYAEHSDDFAIGIVIEAENKKYYITGGHSLQCENILPFTGGYRRCFSAGKRQRKQHEQNGRKAFLRKNRSKSRSPALRLVRRHRHERF